MQTLDKRNTYTPTDTPHVRSNCDHVLKVLRGRDGVRGLKTFSNNPDEALTAGRAGQNLRVSVIYVLSMRGEVLMPTSPGKAKILLRKGKAKVVRRTPFTIQLNYATGETKQPIEFGMDSGFIHIGGSAVTDVAELFSIDVQLRSDMVKLNSERKMYRRTRRSRNLRYRKPRFLNRKKPKGWLAPSIQHKLDSHIKVFKLVNSILPISKVIVEVGAFDIQKIKNPDIEGVEYQQGEQMGFWNTREYVLFRDEHKCKICKGKSKDKVLQVHHIISRQIGGDIPSNLVTLCKTCHDKYHRGEVKLPKDLKISKGFKAEAFMNMVRRRIVDVLQQEALKCEHTYGYITKAKRVELGLEKSHTNDAFVIAGGTTQKRCKQYTIKQVRKQNRKLFKGARSHIKNTAPRLVKGFQRFDKVLYKGVECFIFGRRKTGYFDLRDLNGNKIHSSAKVSDLKLIESSKTLLIEAAHSSHG